MKDIISAAIFGLALVTLFPLDLHASSAVEKKTAPQAESAESKKVLEDVQAFKAEVEKDPATIGSTEFTQKALALLSRIEETENMQAFHALNQFIIVRMNTVTSATPKNVTDSLNMISFRIHNSPLSRQIEHARAQEDTSFVKALSEAGAGDLKTLTARIDADPTYIKRSPLTVLVLLTKAQLIAPLIQQNIDYLSNISRQTPIADLKAIFTHLANQGFSPDERASKSPQITSFMSKIRQLIEAGQEREGLTPAEFNRQFALNSSSRRQLLDFINIVPNAALKARLIAEIAVFLPEGERPAARPH